MPGTCRLCLSISFVNNYIFDDDNKIYLKILACLPVKVARDDKLPKSICNMCSCKVDDFYQFCNRAVEAENKLSGLHDNYQVTSDSIKKNENHLLESRTTQPNSFSQPVDVISLTPSKNGFNTSSKDHSISQRLSLPGAVQMTVVKRETLSPPHSWSDLPNHITTYTQTDDWSNVIKIDEIKEEACASNNRDLNNDFRAVSYSVYPSGAADSRGKRTKDRKKKGKKSKKKRKLKKSNSGHAIKTEYHSDSDDNVSLKKLKTSRRKNSNGLEVTDLRDIKIEAMDHFTDKIDSESDHFVDEVNEDLDVDDDWNCCVCFKRFFNKPDTMKHYRTHYSSPPFDKKTVMNDCLEVQKSDCKKNLYECCFCDMAFHAKSALSNHMNTHGSDKPYQCSLCEKTFKTPLEILKHGKSSHKFMATSEGGDLDVIDGCPRPATKRFMCDICDEAFVYMKYVLSHRLVSHPEARGRQLVNRCLHCRREFTHLNSLRRHLRSHSGLRNFLCNICGKALTSREHLKFHIRIHTGFKPNVCKTCGKGFVKKCNLTLHERVHSGERPYVCSHCGKAFSQRSTLVIHERYHSGARPYVCTLCQKGFVAKGLLSMHLKTSCI